MKYKLLVSGKKKKKTLNFYLMKNLTLSNIHSCLSLRGKNEKYLSTTIFNIPVDFTESNRFVFSFVFSYFKILLRITSLILVMSSK